MALIYIHIGMPKTGSTFLQRAMVASRPRLAELGFAYPEPPADTYARYQHVHLAHLVEAGQTEAAASFVAQAAASAPNVLISAERLYGQFGDRDGTATARWLEAVRDKTGRTIRILVYVRRQDIYAQSLYRATLRNPRMKRGSRDFHTWLAANRGRLDYAARLSVWAACPPIGDRNMIVRAYEAAQWPGGDLLTDFLDALGIPETAGFTRPPEDKGNPSYSPAVTEYLRRTNAERDFDAQAALLLTLRKALPADLLYGPRSSSPYMSPAEQRAFLACFEASNALIARRWMGRPDGVLFREPVGADDQRVPVTEADVRRVADLLAAWEADPRASEPAGEDGLPAAATGCR
jgi:hypothetical protein